MKDAFFPLLLLFDGKTKLMKIWNCMSNILEALLFEQILVRFFLNKKLFSSVS